MKFTLSVAGLVSILPFLAQVHATPLSFKGGVQGGTLGEQAAASASAAAVASASAAAASAAAASAAAAKASATASAASSASSAVSTESAQDAQSSLTLDPRVLATGFENNGQDVQEAGQVPSLTSSNNFINFCLTVPNLPITNGQQITTGSCNPAPMGVIAAQTKMPSSKFVFPVNGQTINEYEPFTITMAINNLDTGFFVNANENYFSAPQQVNSDGLIQGHSHVVVDYLDSLTQTTTTDPTKFAFFKGLNAAATNGALTADVTGGLPAGAYRLSSINTAANHQPALVAVAQHGSLDDQVYFTVVKNGTSAGSNPFSSSAAASATAAASSAAKATATAKSSSGSNGKGGNQSNNNGKDGNQNNQKGNNGSNGKGGNNAAAQQQQKPGPFNPFGGFRGF